MGERKDLPKFIATWYGARDAHGNTNGKINGRFLFSDILKAMLVLLCGAMLKTGWGMYLDHEKNKELPQKFEAHCVKQAETESKVLEAVTRIETKVDDIRRFGRGR
jgi:hypothetical protein